MDLVALTRPQEIEAAFDQLKSNLQVGGVMVHRNVETRGGMSKCDVYWYEGDDLWAVLDIEANERQYWCCFGTIGTNSPVSTAALRPLCEINSPLEGRNFHCRGAFAVDVAGNDYYLHSGGIGGGQVGVGTNSFIESGYYAGATQIIRWPDGKMRPMFVIGRLNDRQLVASIAVYVHAVERFRKLVRTASVVDSSYEPRSSGGESLTPSGGIRYAPKKEPPQTARRDPFTVDPDIIDRGNHGHWTTELNLVNHLRKIGLEPLQPTGSAPPYDVLWKDRAGEYWIAEIKSLTRTNEDSQLRLGLGQVLWYRNLLANQNNVTVHAVLMVESVPTRSQDWDEVCAYARVTLVWPEVMATRIKAG